MTRISSREFNQDVSRAKRAADEGPVYITDRGRPAHVLITFDAYQALVGSHLVLDLLSGPPGVEDIEFAIPASDNVAVPAELD